MHLDTYAGLAVAKANRKPAWHAKNIANNLTTLNVMIHQSTLRKIVIPNKIPWATLTILGNRRDA